MIDGNRFRSDVHGPAAAGLTRRRTMLFDNGFSDYHAERLGCRIRQARFPGCLHQKHIRNDFRQLV